MDFVVFSDMHFYLNVNKSKPSSRSFSSWLDMQLDILNDIFNFANEKNVDFVIHNGDLFEQKNSIPQTLYNTVWDAFRKHAKDFNGTIYFNSGNHDLLTLSRESGLRPFSEVVTVVSEPLDIVTSDTVIRIIPYGMLKGQLAVPKDDKKHFLFTHEDISGLKYGVSDFRGASPWKSHLFSDWDLVFNGHIHLPQVVDNIVNIGSPYITDWGESETQKHFIYYDGKKVNYIPTKHPKFIELNKIPDESEINSFDFYRISVSTDELSDPIFKHYNVVPKISKKRKRTARLQRNITLDEEIVAYVEKSDTKLDNKRLESVGMEIVRDGNNL